MRAKIILGITVILVASLVVTSVYGVTFNSVLPDFKDSQEISADPMDPWRWSSRVWLEIGFMLLRMQNVEFEKGRQDKSSVTLDAWMTAAFEVSKFVLESPADLLFHIFVCINAAIDIIDNALGMVGVTATVAITEGEHLAKALVTFVKSLMNSDNLNLEVETLRLAELIGKVAKEGKISGTILAHILDQRDSVYEDKYWEEMRRD